MADRKGCVGHVQDVPLPILTLLIQDCNVCRTPGHHRSIPAPAPPDHLLRRLKHSGCKTSRETPPWRGAPARCAPWRKFTEHTGRKSLAPSAEPLSQCCDKAPSAGTRLHSGTRSAPPTRHKDIAEPGPETRCYKYRHIVLGIASAAFISRLLSVIRQKQQRSKQRKKVLNEYQWQQH